MQTVVSCFSTITHISVQSLNLKALSPGLFLSSQVVRLPVITFTYMSVSDSGAFEGVVGEPLTIFKTISAFPEPRAAWSLQKSRDGGDRLVLKEGEESGRFSASKMRNIGENR